MKPKLLAAGLLALGLTVGPAAAAGAAGNLNMALSITGGPWKTSVHTAFQTDNAAGLVVGDANRAQAVSSHCLGPCKTVAIAVQVDLASGPVRSIRAINKAIATTVSSIEADTCASAYQFVIAPDEQVVFTPAAKAAIASVEATIDSVAHSTLDCAGITAAADSSAEVIAGILINPASYAPGNPGGHLFPTINVNRYQDNQRT